MFPIRTIFRLSLLLLLVSYISFGWYLGGPAAPRLTWLAGTCNLLERTTTALGLTARRPLLPVPVFRPTPLAPVPPPTERPTPPQATPTPSEAVPAEPTPPPQIKSQAMARSSQREFPRQACAAVVQAVVHQNLLGVSLAIIWILLTSVAFMSPLTSFSGFITRWFRSDTVAFLSVFMMAALAAFILFWLQVFLQLLTILAAEALARLDIQTAGFGERQAFWILTLVSIVGLMMGLAVPPLFTLLT